MSHNTTFAGDQASGRTHRRKTVQGESGRDAYPWIALLGDPLESLRSLRSHPGVRVINDLDCVSGKSLAAVIGVDLSKASSGRRIDHTFRRLMSVCTTLCHQLPGLVHIIIVVGGQQILSESALRRTADAMSGKIHAFIEQTWGVSVVVTVILAGTCDTPDLLAVRIAQRASQPPGIDAAIALPWEKIVNVSIESVGRNEYV